VSNGVQVTPGEGFKEGEEVLSSANSEDLFRQQPPQGLLISPLAHFLTLGPGTPLPVDVAALDHLTHLFSKDIREGSGHANLEIKEDALQ